MITHRVTHYLYSLNGKRAADMTQDDFEAQMDLFALTRGWNLMKDTIRLGELQGVPTWICDFWVNEEKEEPKRPAINIRPHRHESSYNPVDEMIDAIDKGERE